MDAPNELKASGIRLWDSVTDEFELEEHERVLLLQACRIADRLDRLASIISTEDCAWLDTERDEIALNPALVESRQQAITLTRLVASLRLPSGDEAEGALKRPQRRGAARGSYGIRGSVG